MTIDSAYTQVVRYLRQRRYRLGLFLLALVSSVVVTFMLSHPVQAAYSVQFIPNNPELGDTIAVVVTGANDAPTVTARGQTYEAYEIGARRYRAMIPTSPVTASGRMDVRIEG